MVADMFASWLAVRYLDNVLSLFTPLWNIVRFHDADSILSTGKGIPYRVSVFWNLGAGAVAIGVTAGFADLKTMMANKNNLVFGVTIRSTLLARAATEVEEYTTNNPRTGIDRGREMTAEKTLLDVFFYAFE